MVVPKSRNISIVKKIAVFLAVFFLSSPYSFLLSDSKSPYLHAPLLLIDCQKNDAVFQKTCFRQVAYLTRAVVASGLFEDVLSPSNIYFVTQPKKGFVSFEQKRPYKSSKWKDFVLERYRSLFRFTVDKLHRYVLISVSESELLQKQESYPKQLALLKKTLQVYLDAKKIHYTFAAKEDDVELQNKIKKYFVQTGAQVRLELSQTSHVYQKRNQLLSIENELKKISTVKSIFSGADVFKELQVLFGVKTWQQAFRFWEFSDETRSLYFQKNLIKISQTTETEKSTEKDKEQTLVKEEKENQGGEYYISLYQRGGQPIEKGAIMKVLNNKRINPFKASVQMYSTKPLFLPNQEDVVPADTEEDKKNSKEVSLSMLSL